VLHFDLRLLSGCTVVECGRDAEDGKGNEEDLP